MADATGSAPPAKLPIPLLGALLRPLQEFLALEASSGILLLAAAVAALVWANLSAGTYAAVFESPVIGASVALRTVINDGLMTLFFFVVGMEIKRELVIGELRTFRSAALPAIAALGGMVLPAGIYLAFNRSGPAHHGWGVPIATDIAFCVGLLTMLKKRVPHALIVFLTALAIFDDIGGIAVIALFYGQGIEVAWLSGAALVAASAAIAGRFQVANGFFYLAAGAALWYALHHGGIHPTIAGVALGLAVPARSPEGTEHSPLTRFVHLLHPYVAFGVMPLFALANSGVPLLSFTLADFLSPVTLGTSLGLLAGKQLGIFLFTAAAVLLRFAPIPGGVSWTKLLGVSTIGGIGFTVALFIAALGFADPHLLAQAKLGIVLASFAAAIAGVLILSATAPLPPADPVTG
jgi:NhaA family Na+:H+ antiporter